MIKVNPGILEFSRISIEELTDCIKNLHSIFGEKYVLFVPQEINDVTVIQKIVNLSISLQKLKGCEGFDRHISLYKRGQEKSNYFMTVISSYLVDRVDSIVLEPTISAKRDKPDVLVVCKGEKYYIECKSISTSKFDYSGEHQHMFSILRDYINVPHQVSIRYKKTFTDDQLHDLGRELKERVGMVTGDGRIIHNDNTEVQVVKRDISRDITVIKKIYLVIDIIEKDLYDNCNYPGHVYCRDGVTISLSGPLVDYTKVLREKIRKSRHQSPNSDPYVLIIDCNNMLGNLNENIRALSTAFQPKTNTRFSAAMIAMYHARLDNPALDMQFHFVSNPFAKFPVRKDFEFLFTR